MKKKNGGFQVTWLPLSKKGGMNRRIGSIVICLVLVQFKYIAHNEPVYKESRNPIMMDTLKKKKELSPYVAM